jgi:hypothetical protein
VFFLVLARDQSNVDTKIAELTGYGVPFKIICGSRVTHPACVHRPPIGKYDAVNCGGAKVPRDVDVVALNDVDTQIHNLDAALQQFQREDSSLLFVRVQVKSGPQHMFYRLLDALRGKVPIAASGELMLIKREVLDEMLPLAPCKAEDSYILFKALELGHKVSFCTACYVTTERTATAQQEEAYKRRTVGGIYQALAKTKPPGMIKLFYTILPFISPLLLVLGKKGHYWTKGILAGYIDYLRGDRSAAWQPILQRTR